jgi:Mce-associated membrane protein
MTSTPSPTWYDVLGVSRDASPEEIKAAWRNATDKFEPGSGAGQFRMFNEAADVLLDPTRRAAYDESLDTPADPVANPETTATAPPPPAPVAEEPEKPSKPEKAPRKKLFARPRPRQARPVGEPASGRALAAAVVLAVLTVVAIGLAVWFGQQVREDAGIADARDEAPAAAERAAKAVFSYDYRHLPADRNRAEDFMTDSFGKEYLKNFRQLEKQEDGSPGLAVQTKTVVTSTVLGSGVVDAEADKVRVLVYVNQTSQKAGAEPQIFQNRVAMTMAKDDDRWLIDDVKSY